MSFNKVVIGAAVTICIAGSSMAASMTFDTVGAGDFIVPADVSEINYLIVGGGGGGANGHQGGGGAGEVLIGTLSVSAGQSISYNVGAGGSGADSAVSSNVIIGLTGGGSSSFGIFTASGGGVVAGVNLGGHNGSSGGGAACNGGSLGGNGGSGGSNGQACQFGSSMPIGTGQGDYTALLALFSEDAVTAGSGGAGGTGTHAGGGGAGGILINGIGPAAGNGLAAFSALGGQGFGAGGGAGGLDGFLNSIRYGGGDGASGLVYLQYNAVSVAPVPLPAGFPMLLAGLLGLGWLGKRGKAMFATAT